MFQLFRRAFISSISVMGLLAVSTADTIPWPSPDTELNDVDPRLPLGRYVQYEASNTVTKTVILTNGVLTVGKETVNIAEPSHTVVTTNVVHGVIVISTNTYNAVYQDDMTKELEAYATIKKPVVTQNEDGTYTTNYVDVAYINDIPPDDKKADKIISLWDFYCPQVGGTLTRVESKVAPFAAWAWDGDTNGVFHIDLMYTNGVWSCSVNSATPMTKKGEENAKALDFGEYTFTSTNENGVAYVVYTDALKKARQDFIDNELVMYVSKTNMVSVSDQIDPANLRNIQGIVDTLLGIRAEILNMVGSRGVVLEFSGVESGKTLTLNAGVIPGIGSVKINWGDGTETTTNFPCSHTYTSAISDKFNVTISGVIKSISGLDSGTPFASWNDGNSGRLVGVSIDRTVGMEELGQYAFAMTGITSLSFARDARIVRFGSGCFYSSAISSLYGMPDVEVIPESCFYECQSLKSLNGMAQTVKEIRNNSFSNCYNLKSLNGIATAVGPVSLGEGSFAGSGIISLSGLEQTSITEIPKYCFTDCPLTSIAYLPPTVTTIGENAFRSTLLQSLNGIPSSIQKIQKSAFEGCYDLEDARALWNTGLESVSTNSFFNAQISVITFPESLISLTANSLSSISVQAVPETGYRTTIKFRGKTLGEIARIPVSESSPTTYGFPWGLNPTETNDVLIIGVDGEMYYDPNQSTWVTNNTYVSFNLENVPAGTMVSVQDIEKAPTPRDAEPDEMEIMVDWGDGTRTTDKTHVYTAAASPTITVMGRIAGISGKSTAMPFVTIGGSSTNPYLKSASFANSKTFIQIGDYAFAGCTSLETLDGVSPSIVSLGKGSFQNATSLAGIGIVSSTSITEIPSDCFRGCTGITSLSGIPNTVSSIGDGAFRECTSLASIDGLPSAVQEIPDNGFRRCTAITTLDLTEKGFTSVGQNAFGECINIDLVKLDTSTQIKSQAFSGLGADAVPQKDEDGITYSTVYEFPRGTYTQAASILGLENPSGNPTSGLNKETSKIVCADDEQLVWHSEGTVQRWEVLIPAIEIELRDVQSNTTFQVARTWVSPQASVIWNWGDGTTEWVSQSPSPHTYTNATARNYTIKVKGFLESISSEGAAGGGAYIRPQGEVENPYLVGFTLPENTTIRTIGNYSFSRCPNLKNINRSNLPRSRFYSPPVKREEPKTRLNELSKVRTNLPIEYGEFCFFASGIEDLSGMPTNTMQLAEGLFSRNEDLKSLASLPGQSIIDIGQGCFEQTGLTNLVGYPPLMGYVSPYCFRGDTELRSLTGLNAAPILSIGESAFLGCTNIVSLQGLPSSVVTIGASAFQENGISSLDELPSSITNIGDGAFAICTRLRDIDGLSTNVDALSKQVFMYCTNIVSVTNLPSSIREIGDFCFLGTYGLTNFVVGTNISTIGKSILAGCGLDAPTYLDEDRNIISCTIRFPHLSCSQIRELWGNNFFVTPVTAKLIGWDGYIINESGEWVDKKDIIRFRIPVTEGQVVHVGNIFPFDGSSFDIRWGDGSIESGLTSGNLNHTYSMQGELDLYIIGRIGSISSDEPPLPFLYTLTQGGTATEIEIGNNCGIAYLGESCFRGMSQLARLPDFQNTKVVRLGASCFEGCTGIKDLEGIPSSIEIVESNAFRNCSALSSIQGLSNTTVSLIGDCAFEGCVALSSIKGFPSTITNIPYRCFYGDSNLSSLNGIGSSVEYVDDFAFAACTGLSDIGGLTNTAVVSLGDFVFSNCTSLASVSGLPANLSIVGDGCFFGCSSIVGIDSFPIDVETLPRECFALCTSLTSITGLPQFVDIGEECFKGCTSLVSGRGYSHLTNRVNNGMFEVCVSLGRLDFLSDNITEIGDDSFFKCLAVTDWVVPSQITNIGERAIGECRNLTNVVFNTANFHIGYDAMIDLGRDATPQTDSTGNQIKAFVYMKELTVNEICDLENFPFGAPTDTTMFIGKDGYVLFGKKFTNAIEVDIDATAGNRYELTGLTISPNAYLSVTWGDGTGTNMVTSGGLSHVYSESGKYTVTIIGQLEKIEGRYPLAECFLSEYTGTSRTWPNHHVTDVRVPSSSFLGTIGTNAFAYSEKLQTVEIAAGSIVSNIDYSAFRKCSELSDFRIDSTNELYIARWAFNECGSLTGLECNPQSITRMGVHAFENAGITSLGWIPDSIRRLESECFRGCSSLTDFGNGLNKPLLTEIDSGCFMFCNGLGYVEWPSNVTTMAESMFYETAFLSFIAVPNTCSYIGQNAFAQMGAAIIPYNRDNIGKYQSTVNLIGKSATDVLANTYGPFPFGARTSTRFICDDGIIAYNGDTSKWVIYPEGIRLTLTPVSSGDTITINNTVQPTGADSLIWNFGDGTPSVTVTAYPYTHTFAANMPTGTVTCIGKVHTIGNGSNWVTVGGGAKLSELSITKASEISVISENAFNGFSSLENVTLASRLSTIGRHSFCNCTNLNSLTLPDWSVTVVSTFTIEEGAFSNCYSLAEYKSSGAYKIACKSIGNGAFANCSSLELFDLIDLATTSTNVVSNIGSSLPLKTYRYNYQYRSIVRSSHLCEEVIEHIEEWNVPHDAIVECSDGFIFYDNGWVINGTEVVAYRRGPVDAGWVPIKIVNGTLDIYTRRGAFDTKDSVNPGDISRLVIGKDVRIERIRDGLFNGCSNLESIRDLSSSLSQITEIGDNTFAGCSRLNFSGENIFHGVTKIGKNAFAGCGSITVGSGAITFPSCVSFGEEAFIGANVTNINWMNSRAVIGKGCFKTCPLTSLEGYPSNGDGKVPDECFMLSGISSISNLPPTITELGEKSFYHANFQSLAGLGDTHIRKIGNRAFGSSFMDRHIVFPPTIRDLGKYIFNTESDRYSPSGNPNSSWPIDTMFEIPTSHITNWWSIVATIVNVITIQFFAVRVLPICTTPSQTQYRALTRHFHQGCTVATE